jgi:hypothetical protein
MIIVLIFLTTTQLFSKNTSKKKQIIFDDYRVYSHRPGSVKIRRLSDNKQVLVLADKFKIKYYNNGEDIFNFYIDKKNKKVLINFDDFEILRWEGRYVEKYKANFYQIFTIHDKPFHYYIVLSSGKLVALDIEKFNKKIDKALAKTKKELALKFNLTPKQIELILKKKKQKVNNTLEVFIQNEYKEKNIESARNDSIIKKELDNTIGETLADEYYTAIQEASSEVLGDALSSELASRIDKEIAKAVEEGVSAAAAEAGIEAGLSVLAGGGTEAEARAACSAAAGSSC